MTAKPKSPIFIDPRASRKIFAGCKHDKDIHKYEVVLHNNNKHDYAMIPSNEKVKLLDTLRSL